MLAKLKRYSPVFGLIIAICTVLQVIRMTGLTITLEGYLNWGLLLFLFIALSFFGFLWFQKSMEGWRTKLETSFLENVLQEQRQQILDALKEAEPGFTKRMSETLYGEHGEKLNELIQRLTALETSIKEHRENTSEMFEKQKQTFVEHIIQINLRLDETESMINYFREKNAGSTWANLERQYGWIQNLVYAINELRELQNLDLDPLVLSPTDRLVREAPRKQEDNSEQSSKGKSDFV